MAEQKSKQTSSLLGLLGGVFSVCGDRYQEKFTAEELATILTTPGCQILTFASRGEARGELAEDILFFIDIIEEEFPDIYKEMVSRLKALKYSQFLKTTYWRSVALYMRARGDYACSSIIELHTGAKVRCPHDGFVVHHKTYEHHGEEHKHLSDLQLLCDKCHAKIHGEEEHDA